MKNRILGVIAALLVALALATLFLDGVSLSGEVMSQFNGMFGEYGDLFSQGGQDIDIDELARAFGISASEFTSAFNAQGSANALKQFVNMFASGGLSMMETRGMLAGLASIARSYESLAAMSGESVDELKYMQTISIAYTALVVLIFLLAAWALYGIFRRRKARGIAFAVFMLFILIADAIIVFGVNESFSASSGMSVGALSVTPWTILGFLCALVSVVLCFMAAKAGTKTIQPTDGFSTASDSYSYQTAVYNDASSSYSSQSSGFTGASGGYSSQPSGFTGASSGYSSQPAGFMGASVSARPAADADGGSWICPQCGNRVDSSDRFCGACGTPRPEAPQPRKKLCPGCGFELDEEAAFCPQCGARLTSGAQQPYAQPAAGAYQPQQAYAQPAAAYQQQSAAQPVYDAYQAQQPYAQPANDAQQQPAANEAWFQESVPQASAARSGTVRTLVANAQEPLALTFEIDQVFAGVHEERSFSIVSSMTVGRKPHCDLQINDDTVSSSHLQIERMGDSLFVTDLNSTNGTKLNGNPLREKAPLNSGDALEIGHTVLTVRY